MIYYASFLKYLGIKIKMKKILLSLFLCLTMFWMSAISISAKTAILPRETTEVTPEVTLAPSITEIKQNITEPKQTVGELESVVINNRVKKWNGFNSLRMVVEMAIDRGVAANTIVLLLLLPLTATLISGLHYILGLSGYGIFMPTMIAVAFLATGVVGGLVLFGVILGISLLSNVFLRKLKLHFWPARAINLILIGWGTFGLMVLSSNFWFFDLKNVSIFPILFMILLTEEFVRTQLAKSKSEAKKLMIGTLVLAMVGAGMMQIKGISTWVLLHPEQSLILGVVVNLLVGSYTGIRWSEIKRFGKAIRNKK